MLLGRWPEANADSLEEDAFIPDFLESPQMIFEYNEQHVIENNQPHKKRRHQEWEPAKNPQTLGKPLKTWDSGIIRNRL